MSAAFLDRVRFGADGLVPAVVQDVDSGDVLMLAYMNEEALRQTLATRRAHYWSRGRGKLWRKGETSGNEQVVDDVLINCEENSLLLRVRQTGAVCHDGYDTCFYRTLNDDGSLTVVRELAFDPVQVYGPAGSSSEPEVALAEASRRHYGAYVFLRDHDLETVSGTSRRLREPDYDVAPRIADELRELAGVLDGSHRHGDPNSDFILEASQVIYWVMLASVRNGIEWSALRPDRALLTADDALDPRTASRLLSCDAATWMADDAHHSDLAARAHATLAFVGQACRAFDVEPLDVVQSDLADLESRSYLRPYFAPEAA